jgi:hypothetical protein
MKRMGVLIDSFVILESLLMRVNAMDDSRVECIVVIDCATKMQFHKLLDKYVSLPIFVGVNAALNSIDTLIVATLYKRDDMYMDELTNICIAHNVQIICDAITDASSLQLENISDEATNNDVINIHVINNGDIFSSDAISCALARQFINCGENPELIISDAFGMKHISQNELHISLPKNNMLDTYAQTICHNSSADGVAVRIVSPPLPFSSLLKVGASSIVYARVLEHTIPSDFLIAVMLCDNYSDEGIERIKKVITETFNRDVDMLFISSMCTDWRNTPKRLMLVDSESFEKRVSKIAKQFGQPGFRVHERAVSESFDRFRETFDHDVNPVTVIL